MVWPFKQKGIIDLTEHQKRKIVSQADKTRDEATRYKDFSGNSDLFSAISGSTPETKQDKSVNNKLEDIDFKLDNLRKKIDNILNRLEVVEKKAGVYGA